MSVRTKMGMIRQHYNVTDRINFRADAKRFTHKMMKEKHLINSKTMQKNPHVIFPNVNSANAATYVLLRPDGNIGRQGKQR